MIYQVSLFVVLAMGSDMQMEIHMGNHIDNQDLLLTQTTPVLNED